MTERGHKRLEEVAAVCTLLMFLLWLLWHLFHKPRSGSGTSDASYLPNPETGGTVPVTLLSPPASDGKGCGCGCGCSSGSGCPVSPNTISSLNQIIDMGNAARAQIVSAANNTLETLAQINANPLLNIEVLGTQG